MAETKQLTNPISRRRLLAVGGGSTAMAAFLAACGSDSSTTTGTTTMGAGKGAGVAKSGLFKGSDLETIRKFGKEEAEHVEALTAAEFGLRLRHRLAAQRPRLSQAR